MQELDFFDWHYDYEFDNMNDYEYYDDSSDGWGDNYYDDVCYDDGYYDDDADWDENYNSGYS